MIIQIALSLSVMVLVGASAWNNWEHTQQFGPAVAALVIAAELAKPLLPIALIQHARAGDTAKWLFTLAFWLFIVLFSFVNTFGNTVTRYAARETELETAAESKTRPQFVILNELAKAKCPKKQPECPKRDALEAELQQAKDNQGQNPIDSQTVANSYILLIGMVAEKPSKESMAIYITLLWTLLAEIGSAFGGLCIPSRNTKP